VVYNNLARWLWYPLCLRCCRVKCNCFDVTAFSAASVMTSRICLHLHLQLPGTLSAISPLILLYFPQMIHKWCPIVVSYFNWTQLVGDEHRRVERLRIAWNCVLIRFLFFFFCITPKTLECSFLFSPFLGNSLEVMSIINKPLDTQKGPHITPSKK